MDNIETLPSSTVEAHHKNPTIQLNGIRPRDDGSDLQSTNFCNEPVDSYADQNHIN